MTEENECLKLEKYLFGTHSDASDDSLDFIELESDTEVQSKVKMYITMLSIIPYVSIVSFIAQKSVVEVPFFRSVANELFLQHGIYKFMTCHDMLFGLSGAFATSGSFNGCSIPTGISNSSRIANNSQSSLLPFDIIILSAYNIISIDILSKRFTMNIMNIIITKQKRKIWKDEDDDSSLINNKKPKWVNKLLDKKDSTEITFSSTLKVKRHNDVQFKICRLNTLSKKETNLSIKNKNNCIINCFLSTRPLIISVYKNGFVYFNKIDGDNDLVFSTQIVDRFNKYEYIMSACLCFEKLVIDYSATKFVTFDIKSQKIELYSLPYNFRNLDKLPYLCKTSIFDEQSYVCFSGNDGNFAVYEGTNFEKIASARVSTSSISTMCFVKEFIYFATDREIHIWNLTKRTFTSKCLMTDIFNVTCISVSSRQDKMALGCKSGIVNIYKQPTNGTFIEIKSVPNLTCEIKQLKFSSDSRFLICKSKKYEKINFKIYDDLSKSVVKYGPSNLKSLQPVNYLNFSPNNKYLSISNTKGAVYIVGLSSYFDY
ncbi:hypothetical protein A3Q56_04129 [Intoshia linei]|uniref:U3 small nucleolar RNA-associated protein 18 n=1 Tax=Intoshia linei TaxID=1819745 RepID=A0A177B1I4_9BILA|nr:hypothetical protein A3Q56_04129 [Intoshia linei]